MKRDKTRSGLAHIYQAYKPAILLSFFLSIVILFTLTDYGATTDEAVTFISGVSYLKWLKAPDLYSIETEWMPNFEHPPLRKVMGGLSWYIFCGSMRLLGHLFSFRLPVIIFVFVLHFFVFVFADKLFGRFTAYAASLILFFMPRVFYHAHLAMLDYPLMAMWFVTMYAFWKGMDDKRWLIASSVLFGLSLLTKFTAAYMYLPIVVFIALFSRHKWYAKILLFLIIPLMIVYLFWPWLWRGTLTKVTALFLFFAEHEKVPAYFFGRSYAPAPFIYHTVMMILTTPFVVLSLTLVGFFNLRRFDRKGMLFLSLNILLPLVMISLSMLRYNDVRFILPIYPFACIISGYGLTKIYRYITERGWGKTWSYRISALICVLVVYPVISHHPHQSAYFSGIIGGVRGADKLGFDIDYWGGAYKGILGWMRERKDKRYYVFFNQEPFLLYALDGLIPEDMKFGAIRNSDYLILQSRYGRYDENMWAYSNSEEPVFSVDLKNVPLVRIYDLGRNNFKK